MNKKTCIFLVAVVVVSGISTCILLANSIIQQYKLLTPIKDGINRHFN